MTGRHFMLDIETLGTRPDALVLQIGICEFSLAPEETEIRSALCLNLQGQGGSVDTSTVLWWMEQSDAARRILADHGRLPDGLALERLDSLIGRMAPADCIWSHGPAFDLAILQSLYARLGRPVPWHYRAPRDTRTLVTALELVGIPVPDRPGLGVAHSALDDAVNQALWVRAMARALVEHGSDREGSRAAGSMIGGATTTTPVAYRYRYTDPGSGNPVWIMDRTTWNGQRPSEVQPLYDHPATAPEDVTRLVISARDLANPGVEEGGHDHAP